MKRVLIIEPSESDRSSLERIITRLGHKLSSTGTGEEALHMMTESLPDTIIVGPRIPDYDPLELAHHIRENPVLASPPMLLLSTTDDEAYRKSALDAGFAQVVRRPISIRDFYTKLEMCLSNNRRMYIRAPMEFPVEMTHNLEEYPMTTHNFGERGMYIPTEDPLPVDTSVGLKFNLPGLRTLFNFRGQIRHAQRRETDEVPPGMGLQFLDLSPAIDTVLGFYMENFLARRIPMTV